MLLILFWCCFFISAGKEFTKLIREVSTFSIYKKYKIHYINKNNKYRTIKLKEIFKAMAHIPNARNKNKNNEKY